MSDEKPDDTAGGPDETVILRRPVAGRPDASGARQRQSREREPGSETVLLRRPKPQPSSSPPRTSSRGPRKGGEALLADLGLPATRRDGPTREGTGAPRPSTPPPSRRRRGLGVLSGWVGQASWTHVVAVGAGGVLLAAGIVTVALNLRDTGDEVTRLAGSETPPPVRRARPVPAPPLPVSRSSESAPPVARADESSRPLPPTVESPTEPAPNRPEPTPRQPRVAAPPPGPLPDDPAPAPVETVPGPDQLPTLTATSGTEIPLVVRVVAEEDESVLPGVILSLEPGGHEEVSNAEGVWTFYGLPEGVYTLTAALDGYYQREDEVQKVQAVDRVDYTVTLAKIPPPPDPKPLIEAVLEAYRNAYEKMDLLAVQQTYPGISERLAIRLGRQFEATKALEYAFGPPEYTSLDEIEGSARVTVEVTQKLTPNAGPEQEEVFDMEFSFERPGDEYSEEWLIVERARLR